MAKYYVMGNFSQKGVKGFLTGGSNRESVVKSACEAMGCKFISYDITEGEFDFILIPVSYTHLTLPTNREV